MIYIEGVPTVVIVNPELALCLEGEEAAIDGDSTVGPDGAVTIYSPSIEAVVEAGDDVVRVSM